VVLFKEYLFIDDENEYLKRFYKENESKERIKSLSNFYENVFPTIKPVFYKLDVASMMFRY